MGLCDCTKTSCSLYGKCTLGNNCAFYSGAKTIKTSKYGNAKTEYDGKIFDSHRECERYVELSQLERLGFISNLKTQVKYLLIPTQREPDTTTDKGKVVQGKVIERELAYIADFVYVDRKGNTIVEDVKGKKTKEYIIKRKLMLYIHGIKIKEVY